MKSGLPQLPKTGDTSEAPIGAKVPVWQQVAGFAPLWGVAGFIGFYALLPSIPFQRELLVRYCTSHPLEYVTMALFFLGISTLIIRRIELLNEQYALSKYVKAVFGVSRKGFSTAGESAASLEKEVQFVPLKPEFSVAGRRLIEALQYFTESDSAERLDDHLRHVGDLEADRAVQKFGFVNTISWAVPILGFLGTVMGITLAIANVTPDQLDSSLPEVTGGLAVAFDTTALSLSLSLVLVFATYLVRRKQDEILSGVDQQLDHRLCFLLKKGAKSSDVDQHAAVSAQLVDASAEIVSEATAMWRANLQNLETSFAQSLQAEQLRVAEVLEHGVSSTLNLHHENMQQIQQREQERGEQVAAQIEAAMMRWEQAITHSSAQIAGQTTELKEHSQLIISLIDKQQELTELQQRIHHSLDASQITETLDQTLNSLTAAIQLLNARVPGSSRAA